MKRTGQLRRKKALRSQRGNDRNCFRNRPLRCRRSSIPAGSPLRRLGLRALREAKERARFRDAVLARAGGRFGRCERCGRDCSRGGYRLEAHHRHPRSHAPLAYRHDPARNGAALCVRIGYGRAGCHALVHMHAVEDWAQWVGSSAVRAPEGAAP